MKKALFIICFALLSIGISFGSEPAQVVIPAQTTTNNFVLYPTSNIFTFLKLDTRNGRIWQVQYSTKENEYQTILNARALVTTETPGQFAMYPTTNMWTFLLIDTINGDVWHVQWSQEAEKRLIIPIQYLNDQW